MEHTITVTLDDEQYKLLLEYAEYMTRRFKGNHDQPARWASALLSVRLEQWAEQWAESRAALAALDALDARKKAA